jgi:hypothetical protein
MFYAPFDSINRSTKIAVVGVAPGFQQMEIAIRVVRQALHQGATAKKHVFSPSKLGVSRVE